MENAGVGHKGARAQERRHRAFAAGHRPGFADDLRFDKDIHFSVVEQPPSGHQAQPKQTITCTNKRTLRSFLR